MRFFYWPFFLCFIISWSVACLALEPGGERRALPSLEVRKLLVHAVKHSAYEMPKQLPAVFQVHSGELHRVTCSDQPCAYVGYFDRLTQKIFISSDLEVRRTLLAQSYVIHELVHYLQFLQGRMARELLTCEKKLQLEQEAYEVQNRFLHKSFTDLRLPVVRLDVMYSLGQCKDKR